MTFAINSFGQKKLDQIEMEADSISIEQIEEDKKPVKEKVIRDFKPSAVNFGLEVLGLARTITSSGFSQFEAQGDIDFDRYFFVVDIGREQNSLSNSDFNYLNRGSYFRTGIQINMMPYNPDRNFMFFGFRYARSIFSDEIAYEFEYDKWGQQVFDSKNDGVSARWFELNMGMKVKVHKNIYFGYTLRFKLARKLTGYNELVPRNIPGFGRAIKTSNAGFNYYILYHLPFRNKVVPPRPKRTPRERSDTDSPSQSNGSFSPGSFNRNF